MPGRSARRTAPVCDALVLCAVGAVFTALGAGCSPSGDSNADASARDAGCPEGSCADGASPDLPDGRSAKRGVAYNFCEWSFSEGQEDLDLLKEGTTEGSGAVWYYNWGLTPGACIEGSADLGSTVEFVPMAWGLANGGADCASGGACFTDGRSREDLVEQIPEEARYLLGFNEPNFAHQANLTPTVAARAWSHLEHVADARGLELVGPAVNFCDTTPDTDHGGSCAEEPSERTFTFDAYSETFPANHRYNAFEWLELFYDECSASGEAGQDCRIDYQAGHVYSWWGVDWFVELWKRKAGLEPPVEDHCTNGTEDEDEFGVDCGGNECEACSAWAREQFAKALWLTEFAPSIDDAPSPTPSTDERIARASAYIDSELDLLEADPFVFRYAWFMPKTDIASLDHVDLLTETSPVERTSAGVTYLDHPH